MCLNGCQCVICMVCCLSCCCLVNCNSALGSHCCMHCLYVRIDDIVCCLQSCFRLSVGSRIRLYPFPASFWCTVCRCCGCLAHMKMDSANPCWTRNCPWSFARYSSGTCSLMFTRTFFEESCLHYVYSLLFLMLVALLA